ncbi:MAG TPA: hypothetical protein VEU28_11395 [Actinomycetota bacterium]|nr:hypothetical protein [Actinomycetota bacterium]
MPRSVGRFLLIAAISSLLLLQMSIAWGQTTTTSAVESAVDGLRSNPVYVDPAASSTLSDQDADELRQNIEAADAGPIYVAVLPQSARNEAGGSTEALLTEIAEGVGERGTYVVVAGTELRAGSTEFESGVIPGIANDVVQENRGQGAAAVLNDFVSRVGQEQQGGGGSSDGGGGGGGFGLFPILLLAGGGAFVYSRSKKKKQRAAEEQRQLEEVKAVAMEDLVALGDDLRTLDLQVEMPDADPRAKQEYVKALGHYETATRNLDRAQRPQDLQQVTEALTEGRYAIDAAEARLQGREPAARRALCFFDPRHGPSVEDVVWSPDHGAPREVPACAEDARLVKQGQSPHSREITVAGERMPYWDAPGYYGPWAGGYFGGFGGGGLLQGLLIGQMLGGFGGWGGGYHSGWDGGGGDGGDGGFGDFGGGGFGGFGGGDFGGGGGFGDFGGGDFGGD